MHFKHRHLLVSAEFDTHVHRMHGQIVTWISTCIYQVWQYTKRQTGLSIRGMSKLFIQLPNVLDDFTTNCMVLLYTSETINDLRIMKHLPIYI